jgi:hypothetical protein
MVVVACFTDEPRGSSDIKDLYSGNLTSLDPATSLLCGRALAENAI